MSNVVIQVEGLGKRYRIGRREGYLTLRDSLVKAVKKPFGWISRNGRPDGSLENNDDPKEDKYIWALKDISFEVKQGEVVGIIGKNGAGKTTLLKVLSRITDPTEGYAKVRGSVRSLLEVGTGFHPELTGRENIYLSGAILGMSKQEINSKFDEIVSFSEIEKFIDTPVKFYSSGMYVRLAFAVAAHLEPEILLIDEVLAVGDAAFRKKCLGKMGDVAKKGRTVLFVSHNMTAVKSLCERAVLLREGHLIENGNPSRVVNTYLDSGRVSRAEVIWDNLSRAPGNDLFRLRSVRVCNEDGKVTNEVNSQQPFNIEIEYWNLNDGARLGATVAVYNQENICVFSSLSNHEPKWHGRPHPKGLFRSVCNVPGNLLPDGHFSVSVLVWGANYKSAHREDYVVEFDIHETGGARGDYLGGMSGVIRPLLQWDTEYICKN